MHFFEKPARWVRRVLGWIGEIQVVHSILQWSGLWSTLAGAAGALVAGALSFLQGRPADIAALVAVLGACGCVWLLNGVVWFRDRWPRFSFTFGQITFCAWEGDAACILKVRIRNEGFPSIVDNWKVELLDASDATLQEARLKHFGGAVEMGFPHAPGEAVVFHSEDLLPTIGVSARVSRGNGIGGILLAAFPGLDSFELEQASAFKVSCIDAWGRRHSAIVRLHLAVTQTTYMPGMRR